MPRSLQAHSPSVLFLGPEAPRPRVGARALAPVVLLTPSGAAPLAAPSTWMSPQVARAPLRPPSSPTPCARWVPQPSLPRVCGICIQVPLPVQLRGWGRGQQPGREASSAGTQVAGQWPLGKRVLFPCRAPVLRERVGSGVRGLWEPLQHRQVPLRPCCAGHRPSLGTGDRGPGTGARPARACVS